MSQVKPKGAIPPAVVQKLQLVRKRKIWVQIATAAAAAIAVLLAAMGLAMLIDWLATLYDSPWRMVFTAAALLAAAITAAAWLALARRTILLESVAADVDRELPEFDERWTTVAGVGRLAADPRRVHPAMYRRVAGEAARLAPRVEPEQVVDLSPMLRNLFVLTGMTLALGIAVVLDSQQTLVLIQRFWSPTSQVSATEIASTPGSAVVARGEPLTLKANVTGRQVDEASLFLQPRDGGAQRVELFGSGDSPITFVHRMRTIDKPFQYRLRAGDGQTPWHQIDVADRPQIERLRLTITPPAYTRHPAKEFAELPRSVAAMAGSRVELAFLPKEPLKSLVLRLSGDRSVEAPRGADRWHRWTSELTEGFTLTPQLTEPHGLTNRRAPTCEFTVYQDKPPTVKVVSPDAELAVRPDDTIQITFSASDDVGISGAELLVYDEAAAEGEPVRIASIPIELQSQAGSASIQQTVELDLKQFAASDGVELSYEIRVQEDRGDSARAKQPNSATEAPTKAAAKAAASEMASTASQLNNDQEQAPAGADPAAAPSSPSTPAAKPSKGSRPVESIASKKSQQGEKPAEGKSPDSDQVADAQAAADPTATSAKDPTTTDADARTASSGRQELSSTKEMSQPDATAASDDKKEIASAEPPAADSQQANASDKATQETAAAPTTAAKKSQQTAAAAADPSSQPSSASDPPPGDDMSRRALDVPQSASSQRMKLKVDQWAGSFAGQQRAKVEMAISPELEALDQALAKAQRTARNVLDALEANSQWRDAYDAEVTAAEQHTVAAQAVIARLQEKSQGTPYAFVGLQVADVGMAHIEPARTDFWKSLQSEGATRITSLRNGWQQLSQARELVAELRGQYERARREFQLAESVERVKKMYQVYIENSQTLLNVQDSDPTRYNRKMAEFELDDEYLKRLKEVMEMRRDLRAELARILGEDPRLLRRFMDALRFRTNNLREELAELSAAQEKLNREVRAWTQVAEADRPRIVQLLMLRHVQGASHIATAAGELQSRYQTWLSLDRQSEDADLAAATQMVQEVATAASEASAAASAFAEASQKPPAAAAGDKAETGETSPGSEAPAADAAAAPPTSAEAFDRMLSDSNSLYELLTKLEVALRQLAAREDGDDTATFAANRLIETRRLIADASAWIRQSEAHHADNYAGAAEIDQYRLAMQTDELAGKLGAIEQTLSATMQRTDGSLPAPIAEKAREFLAMLDKQASPNQVAAVYSLRTDQLDLATQRQQAAGVALAQAEKLYDELVRLAIEELDKLPVQDPIADLLDDPTLDELLAQLEQETPLEELLGIPERPSNLRIIDDWLRPGNGNPSGGGAQMAQTQMRQQDRKARERLDRAYQRAIARALKEAAPKKIELAKTATLSDWNRLASHLGDDLRQGRDKSPPEQYRRAIEQYFAEIARVAAQKKDQGP